MRTAPLLTLPLASQPSRHRSGHDRQDAPRFVEPPPVLILAASGILSVTAVELVSVLAEEPVYPNTIVVPPVPLFAGYQADGPSSPREMRDHWLPLPQSLALGKAPRPRGPR